MTAGAERVEGRTLLSALASPLRSDTDEFQIALDSHFLEDAEAVFPDGP